MRDEGLSEGDGGSGRALEPGRGVMQELPLITA